MKRTWISSAVLAIYMLFVISCASGSESIAVKGLDNCKKSYYSEIGGIKTKPGYVFLITGFGIKYDGKKSVSVDPSFFALSIDNVRYPNSAVTYYLGDKNLTPLPSVTLEGGGYVEGYVAYEVPDSKKKDSFDLRYTGWEDVNLNYQCD